MSQEGETIRMTEEQIQYKRGRPNKRVLPHHINSGRQEIQPRDIKICTTITQVETFGLSESGVESLEDQSEKMAVINQEYKNTRKMLMKSKQVGLNIIGQVF